ncbi:tyrosine-type recombinase/integrase [Microvirga antarctica]|uniref:tyrosine-type recombinase/integrase n=1 Tax=Microvirga antarctica TaxID=2819233 RepID=UPI001B3149A5|nr:site-specific integrase [Microvirga antarctica]
MKGRGKHPDKALTAIRVRALHEPGRYTDGNGLYLVVDPSGAKRWLLRVVVHGKRRDIGLGGASLVSLSEAREKALSYRKVARDGGDPLAVRRKERREIPTFRKAAEQVHSNHRSSWKNKKHGDQWINTLNDYVIPHFGETRVDQVQTPDVLRVLAPIWMTKPETARRVRQRIRAVMDWAKASGFRDGDNPVEGVQKGLPRQNGRGSHHDAMAFGEVAAFVQTLRSSDAGEITRLALEFLILTASRTSEVLLARWVELDLDHALWTVPAERMKAGRIHRVPLSARCLEILRQARLLGSGADYIFPGRTVERPLSNMVFLMMLRRMKLNVTAHGFRSSFRDWASEATSFPREVAEMALAHTIENKVEAAYRRGDLMEKRREMMEAWALFCTKAMEQQAQTSQNEQ